MLPHNIEVADHCEVTSPYVYSIWCHCMVDQMK